uniref:Bacterial spot disease resistance protein 4 n=1 Tax=Solanum tuberosum TaxID=4113 RepID=M1CXX9_SOLTU
MPEEIGDLEKLVELNASYTLISRPPSSIIRLNKLKLLTFAKEESEDRVYFVFPQVNEGLLSLEELDLSYYNLIDGGLPEDIGCLSSLKELNLCGNNFEYLPRRIAQLSALRSLYLLNCTRLKELPGLMGMQYLDTLDLSYCNLIDGGFFKDIVSSLKKLHLCGNNFEYLPRSIVRLGSLRFLDLSDCKKLTQLPEFPQQLDTIKADWSNDSICDSLFQNISSLQHEISDSHSLSLRVFTSWAKHIPSWFHHQGLDTSVSVSLPENWYVSDNFLGFAVCYSGKLTDITAHLIPLLCDDGMTWKLALSNHSKCAAQCTIHFFLIPLVDLWDASNANGKQPNDYGIISLFFGELKAFGVRLLYKDESELCIGIRRSRNEETSCSSSKKQRSQVEVPVSSIPMQFFPTSPGF